MHYELQFWHMWLGNMRYELQFWHMWTWTHDNYLTIKSDTGQHSQFLRCLLLISYILTCQKYDHEKKLLYMKFFAPWIMSVASRTNMINGQKHHQILYLDHFTIFLGLKMAQLMALANSSAGWHPSLNKHWYTYYMHCIIICIYLCSIISRIF